MSGLDFIGCGIFLTIGVCIGAAIMYFGGLVIDWRIEATDVDKENKLYK